MRRAVLASMLFALLAVHPASGSAGAKGVRSGGSSGTPAARGVYVSILQVESPRTRAHIVCYAEANGQTALTTSITRCTLKLKDGTIVKGPAVTMPGIIAVTGGVSLHKPGPYTACITGKVRYADGQIKTNDFCYQGP